jgi:hypothetical protein
MEPENENLKHIGEIRLEVTTANLQRCGHQWALTKMAARKQKKLLESYGYTVQLFKVTETGGLTQVR